MEVKPMNGYVFVEPELLPEKTKSGLLLKYGDGTTASKLQGAPKIGKVHAVDSQITHIKVGDRVLFDEPNPNGFRFDVDLLPIHIDKIGAIINE